MKNKSTEINHGIAFGSNGKFTNVYVTLDNWKDIEKKLKALEIIKEKKVDVLDFTSCANYETYMFFFKLWNWNGEYDDFILTQEEYDLLKEVLS